MQAVQEALQVGDITSEQADAAQERYAAIHRHFVQAMAKEKDLLEEAKLLNEERLVRCITFSPQRLLHFMMAFSTWCFESRRSFKILPSRNAHSCT